MDLNELLHAHQVEVMKASTSGDENHFGMIAEYADRIRQLRTVSQVNAIAPDPSAPPTIVYGSYAGDSPSRGDAVPIPQTADGSAQDGSENPDRGLTDA